MQHPAGEKSLRRAPSVYSVAAAWYSAPIYTAPVGDALKIKNAFLLEKNSPSVERQRAENAGITTALIYLDNMRYMLP
jgi:hypothetical protein